MMRTTHLALLGIVMMIIGCGEDNRTAPDDIDDGPGVTLQFEHLERARFLQVTEAGVRVFRSASEWEGFWLSHSQASLSTIDFGQSMVIGVFWGGGHSGCSNVADSIEEIVARCDTIEVRIGPLTGLGDCAMPVLPVEVVSFDYSELPVSFRGEVPQ